MRFFGILSCGLALGAASAAPLKKITITGTNNDPTYLTSGAAVSDRLDPAYLRKLRKFLDQHGFPAESTSSSEAAYATTVLKWVSQQWAHDGMNEPPKDARALEILENVYRKKEKYRCVEYGIVLSEALNAHGFVTRMLALRSVGVAYGGFGQGHVAAEVWLNEASKWIFLDGQFGATFTRPGEALPLSYAEIYRERAAGRWKSLEIHFVLPEPDPVAALARTNDYRDFLANYFGHIGVAAEKGKPFIALRLEAKDHPITFQSFGADRIVYTDDENLFYPAMNRVTAVLTYTGDQPHFASVNKRLKIDSDEKFLTHMPEFAAVPHYEVALLTNMPNFSTYEYRTDATGPWTKIRGDHFHWDALQATNRLEMRARNAFDRPGPVTFIDLEYR